MLKDFMLALCIWREARSESILGKLLVGQVIKNRVFDDRWPDTYVGVVTQDKQFSSFNQTDPNVIKFPSEQDQVWKDCINIADFIIASIDKLTTANHYHTKDVKPSWADESKIVWREGHHIFYTL